MSSHRAIQFFVIGFFGNPVLWIAIHHLLNYKR